MKRVGCGVAGEGGKPEWRRTNASAFSYTRSVSRSWADLFGDEEEEAEGQLFTEDPWRRVASEAAAVALLAPVLEEQIDRQGLR